jgi:hypothetical protein
MLGSARKRGRLVAQAVEKGGQRFFFMPLNGYEHAALLLEAKTEFTGIDG